MQKTIQILKWIGVAVVTPILLCLILVMLFYWSPVQNFIADKVADSLSDDTMMVSIGHVELDFPLDIELTNVKVVKTDGKHSVKNITNTNKAVFDINFDYLKLTISPLPLLHNEVVVTEGNLDGANVDMLIPESKDTTRTIVGWKILLEDFEINKSKLALRLPNIAPMKADIENVALEHFGLDFDKPEFSASHITTHNLDYTFDKISINKICLDADTFMFRTFEKNDSTTNELKLNVKDLSLQADSYGLNVDSMRGDILLACNKLKVSKFNLTTPYSQLSGNVDMDLNAFDEHSPGFISADIKASVGKKEIMNIVGESLPDFIKKNYPDRPLEIDGKVYGNMQKMTIDGVEITLPTIGKIKASGTLNNLLDVNRLSADANLMADADNAHLDSQVKIDLTSKSYDVKADIARLNMKKYLPKVGIGLLSGSFKVKGQGFNFDDNKVDAIADIRQLQYAGKTLNNISLSASMNKGNISGKMRSANNLLTGGIDINGRYADSEIHADIIANVDNIDLKKMGFTDERYVKAFSGNFSVSSTKQTDVEAHGYISHITFADDMVGNLPLNADIDIVLGKHSTYFNLSSQSLLVNMRSDNGYKELFGRISSFTSELQKEIKTKKISRNKLRSMLPDVALMFSMDNETLLMPFINHLGYDFKDVTLDMETKRNEGVNLSANVNGYVVDSLRVYDAIVFIDRDSLGTRYHAGIQNESTDSTQIYKTLIQGHLFPDAIEANIQIHDYKDSLGMALGAIAHFTDAMTSVHILGDNAIIDYKPYSVNADNFVSIDKKNHISANLKLETDDKTGFYIYTVEATEPTDSSTVEHSPQQDITLSVNNFRLTQLTAMLPFLPNIKGTLNGDFHLMDKDKEMSIASNIDIQNLIFEGTELGNINTELTLLPKQDGESYLSAFLSKEDIQVAYAEGTYNNNTKNVQALMRLTHFPLNIVDAFITDDIIGLKGYAESEGINVTGTLSRPVINGDVYLDSAYIFSTPYGVSLRFDNKPIKIIDSQLHFDQFALYSSNNNPIITDGDVDFSDLDHISTNVRIRAENFQAISSKRKTQSIIYGKAFLNFMGMLRGELSQLKFTGKADLLASTDITYILKDSPLNTDNKLDGLVTFTDFRNTPQSTDDDFSAITLHNRVGSGSSKLDIDFTLNIVDGTHIKCALNADESNYANLDGGGSLHIVYTNDNIAINGRYNLSGGEMKYSLPIIPLKTFTIQNGSYVEFNGDPTRARLNITATCRTDASVGSGSNCRTVTFYVGVQVSQTLDKLGLTFIIDAPEDLAVMNELATMDAAQKNKLALIMLSTGMYATEDNTANLTMNNALNSFLNGQISNIAGSALNSVDISVGMGNSVDATGDTHTDYNFKFAKRFWNNRVSINLGGTVSNNRDAANGNSMIDDVSLDYRLDNTANRLLTLFYHKTKQDFLEGRITEYGASIVLKKKMDTLAELFRSSSTKGQQSTVNRKTAKPHNRIK
ncbi:MAG: translocation/assembly module TamB domain-containing protein [Prevotella sp.]|nr:translocation/assembly module TamB domain-containing protein [Candidatus Equicola stercoris]